ncbi:MAG: NADH-quinone oxidoreductase subunit C [Balneolaceae bacterium]
MKLDLSPALGKTVKDLSDTFAEKVIDVYQSSGSTFIRVDAGSVIGILNYLKETHRYIYLSDLFGTDRYTTDDRFEVVYNLLSLRDRERLFVKIWLGEEDPEADSVTGIWKSANWFEREVYDMFGVRFRNHPDLRRIYMPEDYEYHPLRKEFPLLGIPGSIDLPGTTPETE